jgi:hypothetical protein
MHLGLHCQVPRAWRYTMTPIVRYFLWGVLLGCGVATVVPYASFAVLLGLQATSGLALGALSGAVYGAAREAVPVVPLLLSSPAGADQQAIMRLYNTARPLAQRLNIIWLVSSGIMLTVFTIVSWRSSM